MFVKNIAILIFTLTFSICLGQDNFNKIIIPEEICNFFISYIDCSVVKLEHKISGKISYVNVTNFEWEIENLDSNQMIDLTNLDTSLYSSRYTHYGSIPVGGSFGKQLIIEDINLDGIKEIVGEKYKKYPLWGVYSVIGQFINNEFNTLYRYRDSTGYSIGNASTDLDRDGLREVTFSFYAYQYDNYENAIPDSIPNLPNFSYLDMGTDSELIVDLDKDGLMEFLYVALDTIIGGYPIRIAEYDPNINNFNRIFQYFPFYYVKDFAIGDYDEDGLMEFVVGDMMNRFYVFEHTGVDNDYSLVFQDTITLPNAFLNASTNDIDKNGKPEFFLGGVAYLNGVGVTKVCWFESDSDNHYQKIRSFYLYGTNVIGNTFLYNWDVDSDGKDDLLFVFDKMILILKYTANGLFDVFYFKIKTGSGYFESVTSGNLFNSPKPDLFISNTYSGTGKLYIKTDLYQYNNVNKINNKKNQYLKDFNLYQNYPNPFNTITKIRFSLSKSVIISLTIYDITGKEVIKLIESKKFSPGVHEVFWSGKDKNRKEVSSQIYIYELSTDSKKEVYKMLLLK